MNNFTDKLNFIPGNIYTVEEEIHIVDGVYEADLIHDNITQDTVAVFTGSKCTGKRINSYAISTPSLTPWKTHIKIFTSERVVYVTYETVGDTVEADDINFVQNAINDTKKALKDEITRATNADNTLTTNLNNEIARAKKAESDEATRAKNAEKTLTTNLNNEISRSTNADNTITTNLNNEISRAKKAEKTLTDNLNSEISRAKAKESDIDTALGNRYTKDQTFTKSEVLQKIQDVIGTAPAALDTLQEIAKALNDDSNFAGTVTTELSKKVNKSGDTMTGTLSIKKSGDNAALLTFDTERPWSFKQGSTGASSTLDLVSSSGDKSFRVLNVDKTKGLEVHTSPTKTAVTIDGNKVYHAGDKPKLSELTNDAGFITSSDVDTSQNHIHTNMTVLNKITQNSLDSWNDKLQTKKITTVTDLDTLRDTCVYYIKAASCPNNPSSNWGTLFVSNEGTLFQIFVPDSSNSVYKRSWNGSGSSWGSWVNLVSKSAIGLGNVDNTSDANKPISNATKKELDKKVTKGMTWNQLEGK